MYSYGCGGGASVDVPTIVLLRYCKASGVRRDKHQSLLAGYSCRLCRQRERRIINTGDRGPGRNVGMGHPHTNLNIIG